MGEEMLEMIVVFRTRSLKKGCLDPVRSGMSVSSKSHGQGDGAQTGDAGGRDSQER